MGRTVCGIGRVAAFTMISLLVFAGGAAVQAAEEIRIGHPVPLTGPLAASGQEMSRGIDLFLESVGGKIAGRPARVIHADSACNPDNALTQTRRLVHVEKVQVIIGPLCGHEGPAVAQVSRESGVPVLISSAGSDETTKWNRTPTVVRITSSSSQPSHPYGEYVYKELGCRNATALGHDYTFGHENLLGALATFKAAGGNVLKVFWVPLGTSDFGPILAGIPAGTQCVMVTIVGADSNRLFEQWFDFGYDRKYKIYGNYWLRAEVLRQVDDRAVGLISKAWQYGAGVDTPESKAFVDAFVRKYRLIPTWFAESNYTAGLWIRTAAEAVNGKVEDRESFLAAVRKVTVNAPRGKLRLDAYDSVVQNIYMFQVVKTKHPILGDVKMSVPVKAYENVSQFWTWKPEEYMARGPYKR